MNIFVIIKFVVPLRIPVILLILLTKAISLIFLITALESFIAFTTTNPDNRYIRFTNIKTNNNLRDFYYRDIVLGEQNEPVYEPTNNYEIAIAFREAGELSGS